MRLSRNLFQANSSQLNSPCHPGRLREHGRGRNGVARKVGGDGGSVRGDINILKLGLVIHNVEGVLKPSAHCTLNSRSELTRVVDTETAQYAETLHLLVELALHLLQSLNERFLCLLESRVDGVLDEITAAVLRNLNWGQLSVDNHDLTMR